ncbi:Cardiolipin synthase A [Streptomyces alboniger]
MTARLPGLLAELGKRLPPARLLEWEQVLRSATSPADPGLSTWAAGHPAAGLARHVVAIQRAWQEEEPRLSGAALALAQSTATASTSTDEFAPQLVVSGPVSPTVPIRLTSGIVVDVIRSARESLVIVSFAAYDVPGVVAEIRAAVDRGVRVDLVLEETTSAARAFDQLHKSVHVWHRADGPGSGAVHAKLIAADRHTALLGSANLTHRAMHHNIEVGVVLRDARTVGRLVDHFRWLTGPHGPLKAV